MTEIFYNALTFFLRRS